MSKGWRPERSRQRLRERDWEEVLRAARARRPGVIRRRARSRAERPPGDRRLEVVAGVAAEGQAQWWPLRRGVRRTTPAGAAQRGSGELTAEVGKLAAREVVAWAVLWGRRSVRRRSGPQRLRGDLRIRRGVSRRRRRG